MKGRKRSYSGTRSTEISARELRNREVARKAAAEGIVLLKNDGMLPLAAGIKTALCGGGAVCTVKGGTGSGDVNEREVISIYQGFLDAGIALTNREWLERYAAVYQTERESWRDLILREMEEKQETNLLNVYSRHVFRMPHGDALKAEDFDGAQAAFYVISRTAGEDADRFAEEGDYYLTKEEKADLEFLSEHCTQVAVIINAGGQIDLQEILALPHLKALLVLSQPGMEGGHALADVLTGAATPCGKLTDAWAFEYEDYPNSATFSHNSGDVAKEYYKEGIYVGYRYFDSFEKKVAYPFGFGLSYTKFSVETQAIGAGMDNTVKLQIGVKNIGDTLAGKEVVQVYASCPQTGLPKEYRRLCGFAKTVLLRPGECETLTVALHAKDLASFSEKDAAWVLEKGQYGLWVGVSSQELRLVGALEIKETVILEKVKHICPLQEELQEITQEKEARMAWEASWHALLDGQKLTALPFAPEPEKEKRLENKYRKEAEAIAQKLDQEQMTAMVIGEISKGQGQGSTQTLGAAGLMVPGAAGETSSILTEEYGVPGISMADGPAGLRLMKTYEVDLETGNIYNQGILGALEGGCFASQEDHENAERWYQYCTAIPVGTMLAQTWNVELMEQIGEAVAEEMREFGVAWWLAPGMNIHRNPLCGRNFEYYSEDPYLSGHMAAAITRGVQRLPGTGTTIKHFACNNQEDNRMGSDSIVSERALREIYLRGFEIAVKEAQPRAIMTSYNLINGIHAANSYDLCTQAARTEWDFQGILMTDWTTTFPHGGSTPWKCIEAGNDLIMPGFPGDFESIRSALASGELSPETLRECVVRILSGIAQVSE